METPKELRQAAFQGLIGIARSDISPEVGVYARNWGAAPHDVADAIHRPLTLSVMTLQSDEHDLPLVFVDGDLGWWKTPQTWSAFADRLQNEFGLPPHNLIFALSHTHAGPPLMEPDASLPGSAQLAAWKDQLLTTSLQTISEALKSRELSTLDWITGRCDLATNRDLPDPDHQNARIVCGFNPGLPADDTLLVGRVTNASGDICATLTNYACHPTTLAWENTAVSPDYPGAMRETIEKQTGAPAFFMLGACGDLAPAEQYVGNTNVADAHGRKLGFASLSALAGMRPPGHALQFRTVVESGAPLAVWRHERSERSTTLKSLQTEVELPVKDWSTSEELEQQRAVCTDRAIEERLRRKRDIRRALGDARVFRLPIYAWRIGDAVLIGCCCEPYSLLQQKLRAEFPDTTIVCMNLINGSLGYLPPEDLYDTDVYPVWQTPFDRGSLELLCEAMAGAIRTVLKD